MTEITPKPIPISDKMIKLEIIITIFFSAVTKWLNN